MTDLQPLAGGNGLYALPTDARWLANNVGQPAASRATLFVALNEGCAKLAASADDETRAALALALGMPTASQWHNDKHPLRTPAAARSACETLLADGFKP